MEMPTRTEGFEHTDWPLFSNFGGAFPDVTAQSTSSSAPPIDSDHMYFQPRIPTGMSVSRTSSGLDHHWAPWDMQYDGFSDPHDLGRLSHSVPTSSQPQSSTFEAALGRPGLQSRYWPDAPTPRAAPSGASLDTLYEPPTSHPYNTVDQSFIYGAAGYSGQHQYQAAPTPTYQSPSSQFSWSQPDLLPSDLTQAAAPSMEISHITPTIPSGFPSEGVDGRMVDPAVGGMLGWKRRSSALGVQTLPLLNTGLLAPPDRGSSNRSPSSASTAGSSSSFSRLRPAPGDLSCHSCNMTFANQGDLSHHLRSHQPYSKRKYGCNKCDRRFQYRKDLLRHLPRHDPHRQRFHCPFRGCKYHSKGFGRQDHLDRHIGSQHQDDIPMTANASQSTWIDDDTREM